MIQNHLSSIKVCVVGLGYVGLPLAVKFGQTKLDTYGFDINKKKIAELKNNFDVMGELSKKELKTTKIEYSDNPTIIKKANFIIVAVPTPITKAKKPDLYPIKSASKTVGENLSKGSIVVFESTVYPGVTEEICLPIIQKYSKLKCGKDWKIGYSPERINPSDKEHTIDKIIKIVSGQDKESLETIAKVYSLVCKAGIHKAPNIKTAEAAKVIENVQRDLNIALVNELSLIFQRLGINTQEVIKAAGTKWNFHKYQPGLVGGHCIGVDPYYLTYRAEELGYHPQVILAGRRINDYMPEYVAELTIKALIEAGKKVQGSKILIMGLTFKENVRDIRNSKAKDIIAKLKEYQIEVIAHDPLLTRKEVEDEFGVENYSKFQNIPKVDGIILCFVHNYFRKIALSTLKNHLISRGILVDIKSFYRSRLAEGDRNLIYKTI